MERRTSINRQHSHEKRGKAKGGDLLPALPSYLLSLPGAPTRSRQAAGRGNESLERQAQTDRHNARGRCAPTCGQPNQTLRLTKRTAVQVTVNAVKVWMVQEVLGVRAEAQVRPLRQSKRFVYAQVHT